jgi:hypothetical protein
MGQAKLRGTKEQRVEEGIIKAKEREHQRAIDYAMRWQRMTPKQREATVAIAGFTSYASGIVNTLRGRR